MTGAIKQMKRYIKASYNLRQSEYNEYLMKHIDGVKTAWRDILYPAILTESDEDVEQITKVLTLIDNHDKSKYQEDEYDAYLNYFYPDKHNKKDSKAFDMAWLLHQKRNPHHWQYWCLIRDEGEVEAMDMPFEYICEMLCDWSSFQFAVDPKSTANSWYAANKNKMTLSDKTRKEVERLLALAPEL